MYIVYVHINKTIKDKFCTPKEKTLFCKVVKKFWQRSIIISEVSFSFIKEYRFILQYNLYTKPRNMHIWKTKYRYCFGLNQCWEAGDGFF